MRNIEIIDKKCKTAESLVLGITACITYKQNNEIYYLVNSALVDECIEPEYFITKDYVLYYIYSSDMEDISDYDMQLLDKLRREARKPESSDEWYLAMMSDDMIVEKCRELSYDDVEMVAGKEKE